MSYHRYEEIKKDIENYGFTIVDKDFDKPWGAFLRIKEEEVRSFTEQFFENIDLNKISYKGKFSPKILIVKPGARLSWQYHLRRAEIWQVLKGPVGVIRSHDNSEKEMTKLEEGEQIFLSQGERHRLIGLESYGIIAEIWQHTHFIPSDEKDIVRVQDDFKRG